MSKTDGLNFRNPAALSALLRGDLANAITAATPGGIEAQEAAGQRAFVANETLPKECLYCTRKQLEQMGIVFGEDAGDLFMRVQLPEGWSKIATDHSMWSKLVDDKGRERATIFYKAAFYDRRAHIGLTRRFSFNVQPVCGWEQKFDNETEPRICVVTDGGEAIWQSEEVKPSPEIEWFRLDTVLNPLGLAWISEHYPDWQDPLAYWD